MKNKLSWGFTALALIGAVLSSGCRTSAGSSGFASAMIAGHSAEEVRQTTAAVFREDNYMLRSANGPQLVFERNGTTMGRAAYGSYGNDVVERVRVQTVVFSPESVRLQCQASVVRHAGDRVLEEEQFLAEVRSGPYQKLMDETARRLK